MRGGLSTIQQTLTPDASAVLAASVSEAAKRNHSQTTPLHVAASLLASPSGFLRNACVRSHPNSSHPLQCRALELCFSVALERLPSSSSSQAGPEGIRTGGVESSLQAPPVSNALMAALKRAQAHQRRGCPEQQQQPLLAVKVELEQLVISILDDPSVSRVMREASFSSPAVKAAIEQSHAAAASQPTFRPNQNMYLNPRLQNPGPNPGPPGPDEMRRVSEILSRNRKKNPILVGENEPRSVMNEARLRIEKGEFLQDIESIQLDTNCDKARLGEKIRELGGLIESKSSGVVLDLGDLKWVVEAGRGIVDDVAKIVARFGNGNGRLWLIGTATCETYLRCQVYYPTMENDWDLQAVPITPRSPFPGMFPRLVGGNGPLNSSLGDPVSPMKTFQSPNVTPRRVPDNLSTTTRASSTRCPQCSENYEQELAKLVANEYEKSTSEVRTEPPLPQWLQNAKSDNDDTNPSDKSQTKDQEMMFKQKTEELQKKWSDTCLRIHPSFHSLGSQRAGPQMTLFNPKLLLNQPLQNKLLSNQPLQNKLLSNPPLQNKLLSNQPLQNKLLSNPPLQNKLLSNQPLQNKLLSNQPLQNKLPSNQPLQNKLLPNKALGASLQLNSCAKSNQLSEKPSSPPRSPVRTELALCGPIITEKDFLGCISVEKFAKAIDTDWYKKLLKGLSEKVWWQKEAASKVASTVTKCREGNGKQRGNLSKGDTWLLFTGPDRVGKKKMAAVISDQINGSNPIMICLGGRRSDEEIAMNFRGKTILDRIVEAVKKNPFSVIVLEDIDEADMIIRGKIKTAMEKGRLADSYGREISLGNIIFILTANWLPDSFKNSDKVLEESKLECVSSGDWGLRLRVTGKRSKRPRRELNSGLSFDLNLMADFEDVSDLTVDHDDDRFRRFPTTSIPIELANFIDDAVVFKPVENDFVRNGTRSKIAEKFSSVVDDVAFEVDDEALEKILGGVWLGKTGLEEWGEKVLVPSFRQLKTFLPSASLSDENFVVRLEIDGDSDIRRTGDLLPSSIRVEGALR